MLEALYLKVYVPKLMLGMVSSSFASQPTKRTGHLSRMTPIFFGVEGFYAESLSFRGLQSQGLGYRPSPDIDIHAFSVSQSHLSVRRGQR
jgi:hypothetical protein